MIPIEKKIWAIAEGYIPSWSTGPEPQFTSHETVCILNTSNEKAKIKSIYIKEMTAKVENNNIVSFGVNAKISFSVDGKS